MRIFKTRQFHIWAEAEGLTDEALRNAVQEIDHGLVDANLGGGLYKKRVATQSRGKSGSLRTLLAFKAENKAFFIYGFAKNKRANITDKEKKAMKLVAKELQSYSDAKLIEAINLELLKEVSYNE